MLNKSDELYKTRPALILVYILTLHKALEIAKWAFSIAVILYFSESAVFASSTCILLPWDTFEERTVF